MRDAFKIKKMLMASYGTLVFVVIIAFTGLAANFAVYLFHSLILGWRDTAPEWYIEVQEWVQIGLFSAASALFWVIVAYRRYAKRKSDPEIQKA